MFCRIRNFLSFKDLILRERKHFSAATNWLLSRNNRGINTPATYLLAVYSAIDGTALLRSYSDWGE